mgnify:CR=1 FL=1
MPNAQWIELPKLKMLLQRLEKAESIGDLADQARNTVLDCWYEEEATDYSMLLKDLEDVSEPDDDIGKFLDRLFCRKLKCGLRNACWRTSPELLEIHDGLEAIWDSWNGIECTNNLGEMTKHLCSTLCQMGATPHDIDRVKKKLRLPEYAARPISVFREETRRLETLKEPQDGQKEKEEPRAQDPE